jgi:hypothetical protein
MQFSKDHIIYTREASLSIVMAVLRVYKRNSMFMDLAELVDQISKLGLVDALQKYQVQIAAQARSNPKPPPIPD